jgi:hypothetical protein
MKGHLDRHSISHPQPRKRHASLRSAADGTALSQPHNPILHPIPPASCPRSLIAGRDGLLLFADAKSTPRVDRVTTPGPVPTTEPARTGGLLHGPPGPQAARPSAAGPRMLGRQARGGSGPSEAGGRVARVGPEGRSLTYLARCSLPRIASSRPGLDDLASAPSFVLW